MKALCIAALAATALFPFSRAQAAELTRDQIILPSAISVDTTTHTAVLPLHHGSVNGRSVWYIITDASNATVARRYGAVYAPALASIGVAATQQATLRGDGFAFAGAPNFAPTRTYVASATGFPPKAASPGAIADAAYSPFVRVAGVPGIINAPIVATGDAAFDVAKHTNTQDRVVAIDRLHHTVTVILARGFFNGKPIYYISPDASDPGAASVERATYVPRLAKADASATIPIGVVVDGPRTGAGVQGLAYLALQTPLGIDATQANAATIGSPFNVLSLIPDRAKPYAPNGYSPLWSAFVDPASTTRITSFSGLAARGKPAGFVVNCPVIAFGDDSGY